ncbi:MAG: PspC domain-containing protein [Candidatus Viridilinea halotolerans]|uniref:PspC domain-containing protein n=1 Tax=Candidatus Viridilinea halotolerans TaxID=2491704 RepID=A0A426U4L9_9CHLR|nr:MAG: PspC domain-containing protein [Candidatus Viridilinea halotolerans]
MQPRLARSNNERMVAGVCGGIAEYFAIDPVIVRLIFVVLTLSSVGLPAYILFWLIMPRAAITHHQSGMDQFDAQSGMFNQQMHQRGQEVFVGQRSNQAQAGRAAPNYYDPASGLPLDPDAPATGRTVNLGPLPTDPLNPYQQNTPQPVRRWKTLGVILIGIGGLILLEQFGIDMSLIFPTLLIVAGAILMRRRR